MTCWAGGVAAGSFVESDDCRLDFQRHAVATGDVLLNSARQTQHVDGAGTSPVRQDQWLTGPHPCRTDVSPLPTCGIDQARRSHLDAVRIRIRRHVADLGAQSVHRIDVEYRVLEETARVRRPSHDC